MLQTKSLTFPERSQLSSNSLSKRLFALMEEKETNLGLVGDVTSSRELLDLADRLGSHLCVLKTHIDILEDFTPEVTKKLRLLSEKHNFLLFEDRKFADIGHTAQQQYQGGIYRIADWAHLTNAHGLPGEGQIKALQQVGLPKGNGLLLIAQLSSKANLIDRTYTEKVVKLAEVYSSFVTGFICQEKLTENPSFVHMTPGVKLQAEGDVLGQQYNHPSYVVREKGADVILVGRGILNHVHPIKAAEEYRDFAWRAYKERCTLN